MTLPADCGTDGGSLPLLGEGDLLVVPPESKSMTLPKGLLSVGGDIG